MRRYLELRLGGETWISYPMGLLFPRSFSRLYPFRGRGIVSAVLYLLNRSRLDRFILAKNYKDDLYGDVAYFWPSRKRSADRYYGYKVREGKIVEYLKFATSDDERTAIRKEYENLRTINESGVSTFRTPVPLGVEETDKFLVARFTSLPENASSVAGNEKWLLRIEAARRELNNLGYFHGDFGMHNIKAVGEDLWILDWEEMRVDLPRLTDAISFLSMYNFFVKKASIQEIARIIENEYKDDMDDAISALRSMKDRNISMGALLLKQFEGEGAK